MKKKLDLYGWRFAAPAPQFALAVVASAGLLTVSTALAQEASPAAGAAQAAAEAKPARKEDSPTVIVTGTVGKAEARAANVAYSVLDAKDMGKFTPLSADDMLRDMPGVMVETNEGVVRNEAYTRGMSVGTGSPTTSNFWASYLEDGLPIIPVKWNNFQDGNFLRNDLTISRVEAIRGGSSGTSVGSSAGAVFNFMPGAIRNGTSIQTKLGVEGENPHLSWKEVDFLHGWRNEEGDLRANIGGFYRRSNGTADPGYPLNLGGQVKARVEKSYETAGGGSGTVALTIKHLDDMNSWNGQFTMPSHGYQNPDPSPGFTRGGNMFMQGGQHTVRTDVVDGPGSTMYHDPTKGANYKQNAIWAKWDHETGGPWSFSSAVKYAKSESLLQQGFYNAGPVSLWNVSAFQDPYVVNQGIAAAASANLNRRPGYYELYDLRTGAVRARIANNVGKSNGINYRTGLPCASGSAASPAQCVTYTNLPNANFDLGGGVVNGIQVPASTNPANQDLVYMTNSNLGNRVSRDIMFNFMATYSGSDYKLQAGVFASQSDQRQDTWFNGRGLSAFESGNVSNLGARFVSDANTYQLSDEGGWGRVGGGYVDGGFTAYSYRDRQRDIQPILGASWSPGKWDLNASYKGTQTKASTYTVPYATTPQATGANSLSYGGLDGNPLTWYDNQNYVRAAPVEAHKQVYLKNYSASLGYNVTPLDKVYYRHSLAGNNITGILNRYQTQFNADNKPLFPQVDLKQDELSYVFDHGSISGQVTAFRTEMLEWIQQTPLNTDGTTYVLEYLNHYVTKGVEAGIRWRATRKFTWNSNALFSKGKAIAVGSFSAGSPGPEDDVLTTVAGIMARTPKWVLSNTFSYELGDFQFNLRHRYTHVRKLDSNPANTNYLPKQRNFDLSVMFAGVKNLRLSLDIRNVLNNKYISAYDTMVPTATGVSKSDIMAQLPNSASWVVMNPPRSYWLTARYDF
jgi:outer membrane receptor protein involved in Fe transport